MLCLYDFSMKSSYFLDELRSNLDELCSVARAEVAARRGLQAQMITVDGKSPFHHLEWLKHVESLQKMGCLHMFTSVFKW